MYNRETFERIKNEAIEETVNKYFSNDIQAKTAMKTFLEEFVNRFMIAERSIFLENAPDDKANGFYPRNLVAGAWSLNLNVPRVRKNSFRPSILPQPHKRSDQSFTDLIMSLVANGYSEAEIMNSLKTLGLPYSESELIKIKDQIKEKLDSFKKRELPSDAFALLIDGYHCEVKETSKVKKACIYVVLGIDLNGNKDIFGFYTFFGSENKVDWINVFNDLIERGLKRVLLVVSDALHGLDDAVKLAFPLADHQLCYVHLQRNVRRNMSKSDASVFNKRLNAVNQQTLFEDGLAKFEELCHEYLSKYPRFIKSILSQKENYVAFLKYPSDLRKHIYTTNAVESFNSIIEKARLQMGGFFQSVEIAEINIMLSRDNLKLTKWRKPIPGIRSCIYEITQMFNLRYYPQTQDS